MNNISKTFNHYYSIALLLVLSLFAQSCAEPADKFFATAILNTNTISDFGTPILVKHINDETVEFPDIPSSKKNGDEAGKLISNNILYMEKSLNDIKALNANSDDISRKSPSHCMNSSSRSTKTSTPTTPNFATARQIGQRKTNWQNQSSKNIRHSLKRCTQIL